MSSKRGRKRNDALPPSRARDVQRAFRARRAAHLEALEDRVAVLEHENNVLRAALSLPPSERPPLGRGPTGKEKPRPIFESSSPPLQLVDPSRRPNATTASTDASDVSQSESPPSSSTASCSQEDHAMQPSFPFPQWDNALIIREDMVDSDGSSPHSAEGRFTPPLKIAPLAFPPHQPLPTRPRDANRLVGPDHHMHTRSTTYSQSSSASSAGPDGFSPVYVFNEIPEDTHTLSYHAQNPSRATQQHLSPLSSFSFQCPMPSASGAGADHPHSPSQYLSSREAGRNNGHILNISNVRQSPQEARTGDVEPLGHRRAVTEPQTLRALPMQDMAIRGHHGGSLSAHTIRVPSPPPVPMIDRDVLGSRYSMA